MDAHIWYTDNKLCKYSTICVLYCHKQIYNPLKNNQKQQQQPLINTSTVAVLAPTQKQLTWPKARN